MRARQSAPDGASRALLTVLLPRGSEDGGEEEEDGGGDERGVQRAIDSRLGRRDGGGDVDGEVGELRRVHGGGHQVRRQGGVRGFDRDDGDRDAGGDGGGDGSLVVGIHGLVIPELTLALQADADGIVARVVGNHSWDRTVESSGIGVGDDPLEDALGGRDAAGGGEVAEGGNGEGVHVGCCNKVAGGVVRASSI